MIKIPTTGDEKILVFSFNVMLLRSSKMSTTDTYYNIDEFQIYIILKTC